MKAIFYFFAAAFLLSSTTALAGPLRNCRPEDRLPGKRCADEWAVRDEGGGRDQEAEAKTATSELDQQRDEAASY